MYNVSTETARKRVRPKALRISRNIVGSNIKQITLVRTLRGLRHCMCSHQLQKAFILGVACPL